MAEDGDRSSGQSISVELDAVRAALEASEERLALLFEAAGAVGWWNWLIPEDRLYAHAAWVAAFGLDPEVVGGGAPLARYIEAIHPDDRQRVEKNFRQSAETGDAFAEEFRIVSALGAVRWISTHGRVHFDDAGNPVRHSGVAIDVTGRKATERRKSALVELGDRLRELASVEEIALTAAEIMAGTMKATRAGFGTVDQAHETVSIQPDWRMPGSESLEGLHRFRDYGSYIDDLKRGEIVVIGDVTTDPRTREHSEAFLNIGIRVLVNVPILEHGRFVLVLFVHHHEPHDWTEAELKFVRTVADRTQAAIARLRAEEQQQLLHRELSHRLKNNLAMVQSIVNQSLYNAPDVATARTTVEKRLEALGRAHHLLTAAPDSDADILAVVEGALEGVDGERNSIHVSGSALPLNAQAALSLALMLHELATNAIKYGSLSVSDGKVDLSWRIEGEKENPVLGLTWRERGGPRVEQPQRQGFGTRLIQSGVASGTGGQVRLDFLAEGLVCSLTAPLSRICQNG